MGDSGDGSGAAQGAHPPEETEQRGLWGRLSGMFSPGSDDADAPRKGKQSQTGTGRLLSIPGLGNLRLLRVDDVAIPKAEIVAVSVDISKAALVEVFRESGFSRLPVYKDTLDKPLGLVLLKDLALEYGFNGTGPRFSLRKLLRPLLFAPPSMPLGVLLQKMQTERSHMALVIDEYGGVDGLVTIEDLIEQVVGEIEDEHDTAEDGYWVQEKPGCYLVQARAPLDEFEAEIGRSLTDGIDDEEVDTLGGLVFILSGRVPARGEVVTHGSGIQFEVVDADPRRIKRLRVRFPEAAGKASGKASDGASGRASDGASDGAAGKAE
ncbi:magnesium and cobalt transporter [Rhodobacteraceae bacterium MBR-64]|jgi:magnesium and cobalt transporter